MMAVRQTECKSDRTTWSLSLMWYLAVLLLLQSKQTPAKPYCALHGPQRRRLTAANNAGP